MQRCLVWVCWLVAPKFMQATESGLQAGCGCGAGQTSGGCHTKEYNRLGTLCIQPHPLLLSTNSILNSQLATSS